MPPQAAPRLARLPPRHLAGGFVLLQAADRRARLLGLAHLDPQGLPRDHGLLFAACRSVHTLGMRFALDLVWLGPDGRPVRVDTGVAPRRLRTCRRARGLVEVHAGAGPALAQALRNEHEGPTTR